MPHRPPGFTPAVDSPRLHVLAISDRTFTFELPRDEAVKVGSSARAGLRLASAGVLAHHLSLRASDDGVAVELVEGNATLNDVQLSGPALARPGDEIAFGTAALVVLRTPAPLPRAAEALPYDGFEAVVSLELRRSHAHPRPFQLWFVESPAAERGVRETFFATLRGLLPATAVGELGPRTLALFLPDLRAAEGASLLSRVVATLGRAGIRFAVGTASFPEDGDSLARLFATAYRKLEDGELPEEEPVVLDPVMVRLWGLVERLAHGPERIHLWGEDGVGKSLLARALHQRTSASPGGFVLLEGSKITPDAVAKARRGGQTLYLRSAQAEKLELPTELRGHGRLVISTSTPPEQPVAASLYVPPLRARGSEILPLAELFVARFARAFGRERRVLGSAAQKRLTEYAWPGNVRELRNAMAKAVLASRTAEISPEALPPAIQRAARASALESDLRTTLDSTEREVLLSALAATSWNVTQAAKQLGLPRRTVVYRMARLGLKRPSRR